MRTTTCAGRCGRWAQRGVWRSVPYGDSRPTSAGHLLHVAAVGRRARASRVRRLLPDAVPFAVVVVGVGPRRGGRGGVVPGGELAQHVVGELLRARRAPPARGAADRPARHVARGGVAGGVGRAAAGADGGHGMQMAAVAILAAAQTTSVGRTCPANCPSMIARRSLARAAVTQHTTEQH
jgi:hypothetical protein